MLNFNNCPSVTKSKNEYRRGLLVSHKALTLNYLNLAGANRSSFILNDFLSSVKTDTSSGKPLYFFCKKLCK